MTTGRPGRVMLILAAAIVVLASCGGGDGDRGAAPDTTEAVRRIGNLRVQTLNAPAGQEYRYAQRGDSLTITAPDSNGPVNLKRFVGMGTGEIAHAFWPNGQPERADQQVCVELASVVDASTMDKATKILDSRETFHLPGVALRVQPGADGKPTRSITVSQSVYYGMVWTFDVVGVQSYAEGTGASASTKYLGQLDFGDVLGRASVEGATLESTSLVPPPWHLCAKVVGTTLSVMVWPSDTQKPSWDDDTHVREAKLSRYEVYPGYAGGYVRGLSPGFSSEFVGLSVTSPY